MGYLELKLVISLLFYFELHQTEIRQVTILSNCKNVYYSAIENKNKVLQIILEIKKDT